MPRQIFQEWRDENDTTRFPFAEDALLVNNGKIILEGSFLDAVLYPVGGQGPLYLSQVIVGHDTVSVFIGDEINPLLASGSFSLPAASDTVTLTDTLGRPAGLLISQSQRLGLFAAWGTGTHPFSAEQTPFAATVCIPTPEIGVRGVLLDDGTLLTGEVWLIGDDGVVLSHQRVTGPDPGGGEGPKVTYEVIRIDVVGDPLFRRRLCTPQSLFTTPRFLKTITFDDGKQIVTLGPDTYGNIAMTVNNDLANDTILRIRQMAEGNVIEVAGTT